MKTKIIIAGGRDFKDFPLLEFNCDRVTCLYDNIEIVSGKQVTIKNGMKWGADYLGEVYAIYKGYPVKPFPADWDTYGKAAGPIRNREMADYADVLIAFWDGQSTGTGNMINEAYKRQIKTHIFTY